MGFKFPTVNKFLFCLDLETGGIICGWLTTILSAIGAIALTISLVLSIIGIIGLATDSSNPIDDGSRNTFIGKRFDS